MPKFLPRFAAPCGTVLFLCLASLALPARADGEMVRGEPQSPLIQAQEAIKAGDWRNAAHYLGKAEREEPRNASVRNWQGYVARKQGRLDEAFRHYDIALKLDPDHRGAHEYIGEAYVMAGKPDKAREHLAQLERICGRNCEQYRDLAVAIAGGQARK